jgi:NADH-quinone oxidoreductase subunit F
VRTLTHPTQLAAWKAQLLEQRPAAPKTVVVSNGTCGRARGSTWIIEAFRKELESRGLEETIQLKVTGCHGFCEMEPNLVIYPGEIFYGRLKPEDVPVIIDKSLLKDKVIPALTYEDPKSHRRRPQLGDIPFYRKQMRHLTEDNLRIDPDRIETYILTDGYQALAKALFDMTAEEVIREVDLAGLRGRGGAGFPTGRKWQFCRNEIAERRYIICNADEGNPGTYMDRSILAANPHSVIEGMIIGAYAMGAAEGYIYVRMEAPQAVKQVTVARDQARKHGRLGVPLRYPHCRGRRGFCLRRRDLADVLDRGTEGGFPPASPVSRPVRAVGLPDQHQ